jgi:hypothetical protein
MWVRDELRREHELVPRGLCRSEITSPLEDLTAGDIQLQKLYKAP